tara:strand:+ start:2001 stop:2921 length:921 start_codon:yes stop_codon:yes gene_type:complete
MKNIPLVSIVINCYNGEKFLKKCFQSVLNQSYKNWEIIFWDNCSTDRSKIIFDSYKDHRFKYFKSKFNVSLGQARLWAVNKCKGDFISFLDVDDIWFPKKTEIQVKRMMKDNSALSYGSIIEFDKTGMEYLRKPVHCSGKIFKNQLLQFDINVPSSMINRKILLDKKLNFDKNIFASEEYCLFMQLIFNEKVTVINKPLAKYFIRSDSLTNQKSHLWAKEREYTLNLIIKKYPNSILKFPKEFKEAYSRAYYYRARHAMFKKEKTKAIQNMRKICFNNLRYFFLYLLLFFPDSVWNRIHEIKNRRS